MAVFYVSVTLSLIFLAVIGVTLCKDQRPGRLTYLLGVVFAFGHLLCMVLPCLSAQCLLLWVLDVVDSGCRLRSRTYYTAAWLITVAVYLAVGWSEFYHLYSLRQQFPYESMESRLPAPHSVAALGGAPIDMATLEALETRLDQRDNVFKYRNDQRRPNLETLHEHAISAFINSPGFGSYRMSRETISSIALQDEIDRETKYPQLNPKRSAVITSGDPGELVVRTDVPDMPTLHENSILDFVYAPGFGYLKDRRHVAGFRPHQFRTPAEPKAQWRVETLELVGLVLHENPIAYVSDLLPRMDVLRDAPIRSLDAFEAQGLAELRDGKTLFCREQGDRLLVLGAIPATKQCLECHGCHRGDLLGAFSYVLRKR